MALIVQLDIVDDTNNTLSLLDAEQPKIKRSESSGIDRVNQNLSVQSRL